MNRIILIFITYLILVSNFVAQERLTLDDCLNILFKNSSTYKMLQLQNKKNELNYELSTLFKYPTIDLNLGIPFKLSQDVEDVFNSTMNQYTLILNNSNMFFPKALLSSSYDLPTGGIINVNFTTYYNAFNSKYSNDRESFQYSFYAGLSQPLFGINNYMVKTEITEHEFQIAKLNYFKNKNELIFSTIVFFYNTLLKQRQIILTKRRIEKEKDELKEQKLKLKLGKTSELEFVNKKVAVKNSELDFAKAKEELIREMIRLLSFLGINNDSSIVLEESVEFVLLSIPLDDAFDLALKNNPDYKILELYLIINQLDYKTKTTSRIETDLTASTLFSNQLYYLPYDKKIKAYDYNFGITVKVPILDGGQREANAELSRIRLNEIKNDLIEKEKNLKILVSEYYNSFKLYKVQYLLQKEKLKIFKDSYETYRREHNLGRLTFLELQEHESEIYKAEKDIIETVINYNKKVLLLKTILGMEIF